MQKELKAVQCVGDLPTTLDDIKVIRDPLEEKYKFVHLTGKDGEFDLSDNPEWETVRKTRQHLIKLFRNYPDKKYVVIYVIAGHGII